jgi:hypothetical protein
MKCIIWRYCKHEFLIKVIINQLNIVAAVLK